MAIVTMPTNLMVGSFGVGQARYDMAETSDASGDVAVRTFGPPRWRFTMGGGTGMSLAEGAKWQALLLQLRGRVNTLAAFDPVRTLPQGTMRISPMVDVDTAAGVASIVLSNAIGTLSAGDWLQFGTGLGTSQTVKVVADASSSILTQGAPDWVNGTPAVVGWVNGSSQAVSWVNGGKITVTFEPPLRKAQAASTSVNLDHCVVYCKATNPQPGWIYRPGSAGNEESFALDLLEVFG